MGNFWGLKNVEIVDWDGPHPNEISHDLIGRIILSALASEVDSICLHGDFGEEPKPIIDTGLSARTMCLAKPITDLDTIRDGRSAFILEGIDNATWVFRADRKGKAGWVANEGVSGKIGFTLATHKGSIQVEVLGTYENIGSVTCWLDEAEPHIGNECRLDGLWRDKVSLSRFYYMRTSLPSGRHILWCRSDRQKFKIISLLTC